MLSILQSWLRELGSFHSKLVRNAYCHSLYHPIPRTLLPLSSSKLQSSLLRPIVWTFWSPIPPPHHLLHHCKNVCCANKTHKAIKPHLLRFCISSTLSLLFYFTTFNYLLSTFICLLVINLLNTVYLNWWLHGVTQCSFIFVAHFHNHSPNHLMTTFWRLQCINNSYDYW